jgi:hypothetical protein
VSLAVLVAGLTDVAETVAAAEAVCLASSDSIIPSIMPINAGESALPSQAARLDVSMPSCAAVHALPLARSQSRVCAARWLGSWVCSASDRKSATKQTGLGAGRREACGVWAWASAPSSPTRHPTIQTRRGMRAGGTESAGGVEWESMASFGIGAASANLSGSLNLHESFTKSCTITSAEIVCI